MKVEPLKNSESVLVTVHFDDISAKDALSLSRQFQSLSKDMGLFVAKPNKYDHLKYTDLYFRVPEQPEGWQDTFMKALQNAVEEKGWELSDEEGQPTQVSELEI